MVKARGQAEAYAKALPAGEGWPPFLIVVDVGHSIELYSEFTRSGKAYVMFPDPQSFRLKLADLRDEKIRARLAAVWTDPLALDPSRRSAKVTRELAQRLAELAKLLEKAGHDPAAVAKFLMRCLFTMFAEDVELIPRGSFKDLLESMRDKPDDGGPQVPRQVFAVTTVPAACYQGHLDPSVAVLSTNSDTGADGHGNAVSGVPTMMNQNLL